MTKNACNWSGQNKKIARNKALDYVSSPKCAGILLPSNECQCAIAAISKGTVQKDKPMYILEREGGILDGIKSKLSAAGYTNCSYSNRIENISLAHPVDWVYLDFMGSIDENTYHWMRHCLSRNLSSSFYLSFCWNYAWRPDCPFLKWKHEYYDKTGALWKTSCRYDCQNDYRLATYLTLIKEMFNDFVFCCTIGKPYFKYNDNVNPVVLYTIRNLGKKATNPIVEDVPSFHRKTSSKVFSSSIDTCDLATLLSSFSNNNLDRWRQMCDIYCQKRYKETGTHPIRFLAAVKMRLTKLGYDTSLI